MKMATYPKDNMFVIKPVTFCTGDEELQGETCNWLN